MHRQTSEAWPVPAAPANALLFTQNGAEERRTLEKLHRIATFDNDGRKERTTPLRLIPKNIVFPFRSVGEPPVAVLRVWGEPAQFPV